MNTMRVRRLVVLESPYQGDVERNLAYARRALAHSLSLGEAPIASHLLYTQILDDRDQDQRAVGISAGLSWFTVADAVVVYDDLGVSPGMILAMEAAQAVGIAIEHRKIGVAP